MTDVVMPQMGESIVEGTLTRWLKKPGERVERDEPLFEISTDKVDTEIPSPVEGVLTEILVQEGATVEINAVVARIGDGASAAAPAPTQSTPAPAPPAQQPAPPPPPPAPVQERADVGPSASAQGVGQTPPPTAPTPTGAGPYPSTPAPAQAPPAPSRQIEAEEDGGPLSPLVRKMAREYNIDLAQVRGTGAGGRITKQDVEAYMSSQAARTYSAPAAPPQPVAASAGPYPVEPPPAPLPLAESDKIRTEP